jgi:opacity protein-like surface antigen
MVKQLSSLISSSILAILLASGSVHAEEIGLAAPPQPGPASKAGFYGGVALHDEDKPGTGIDLGSVASSWAKFGAPGSEDSPSSGLMFAGYRFNNAIAIEASAGQSTGYALRLDSRPPVGVTFAGGPGINVTAPRSWNLDVYTSYNFAGAFSLYGRVGYLQSDPVPGYLSAAGNSTSRALDGVNYGVGMRYDVSPALGLKLEYARFGRYGFDTFSGPFPESDQVRLGVQYRF